MEIFIEKVRNEPCLWNVDHMSYRDVARKELTWERISKECGLTNGREAKSQWKKLRDSHREALRRRKPSSGLSAPNLGPWKYEKAMKFILTPSETTESCDYNEGLENMNSTKSNIGSDDNTIEYLDLEPPLPVFIAGDPRTSIETEINKINEESLETLELREKLRNETKVRRDRQRQYISDSNRDFNDALSLLFESLCQKTRDLPKFLQLRVQREVFNIVSRAEEEALSLETNSTTTTKHSEHNRTYSSSETSTLPECDVLTKTREYSRYIHPHTSTTVKIEAAYVSSPSPDT